MTALVDFPNSRQVTGTPEVSGSQPHRNVRTVGTHAAGGAQASPGARVPSVLAGQLARQRNAFYRGLAKRDPEQRVFLSGWLNRVEGLVALAT